MAQSAGVPPSPPRVTGNPDQDFAAMVQYLNDFYKVAVLQGYFASQANLNSTQTTLQQQIDPATATAATAQETANDALTLAQALDAERDLQDAGQFVIEEAETTEVVNTIPEQPDTDYYVVVTPVAFTSTPPAEAFLVVDITKTTTEFTVTIHTAPGAGCTVTYDWHLRR